MDEGCKAAARRFSRRSLFASTGLLGLAAVGATGLNATTDRTRQVLHSGSFEDITPMQLGPVIRTERVYSAARNREVDIITILPPGVRIDGLPMSLLLHGRKGNARTAAVGGLPELLTAGVLAHLIPAFGFIAVDGGDNYWHRSSSGDDPMTMLLDEVPQWLAERRLGGPGGTPFACTGVSMGGFGAMLYARRRTERGRPANAVATISPGLLTSWTEMSTREAFADEAQWASLDPLRHVHELGPAPMGLWCGDRDRFIEGCRAFIGRARLEVASITPGGHNEGYWRTVAPDVIRFLAGHVR
ncbi:alpha/beta hydrolase [Nocardia uniformis]|uniref:Alpha/beta hydrolase n=2 Tax=Nocardia uniformis TaxID=53432 RepID=A0A849C3N5_9NOCA|nr:alpha/beta hydrolase [Nocardia uniformis]